MTTHATVAYLRAQNECLRSEVKNLTAEVERPRKVENDFREFVQISIKSSDEARRNWLEFFRHAQVRIKSDVCREV